MTRRQFYVVDRCFVRAVLPGEDLADDAVLVSAGSVEEAAWAVFVGVAEL